MRTMTCSNRKIGPVAGAHVRRMLTAAIALFLLLYAEAAAMSDINVWMGTHERDSCYAPFPYTETDSEAGCGLQVVKDGRATEYNTSDERALLVANGRNPIFVRTEQGADFVVSELRVQKSITLKMLSESSEPELLCSEAGFLRTYYKEGLRDVALNNLPDPEQAQNPASLRSGPLGTVINILPFAQQRIRQGPYPELTVVLVPLLVTEITRARACPVVTDVTAANDCFKGNVTVEALEVVRFKVRVRTEPALEGHVGEVVQSCWFAADNSESLDRLLRG